MIIEKVESEEERVNQKIIDEVNLRLPICYVEKHRMKLIIFYTIETQKNLYVRAVHTKNSQNYAKIVLIQF